MLASFYLYNLPSQTDLSKFNDLGGCFTLNTCQRSVVITQGSTPASLKDHSYISDQEAYHFLLEVICGLKSRLIGENEIVSQFKVAYKEYVESPLRDNSLLLILEKLFRDAKKVRAEYLTGISQKTYASITRKEMVQKKRADHVLIMGSGQLAQDLINQFAKHSKITLIARNTEKLAELQNSEKCEIIPWEKLSEVHNFRFICNTIGFDGTLLGEEFFKKWSEQHKSKLFIDLGSPSCIKTRLKNDQGVLRLDDIFNEGAIKEEKKKSKILQAQKAIHELASSRKEYLTKKKQRMIANGDNKQEQYV